MTNLAETIGYVVIFFVSGIAGGVTGAWLVLRRYNLLDDDD